MIVRLGTHRLQQHRTTGELADRRGAPCRPFPRRYTNADVGLLAELDVLHGTLSGPATRPRIASLAGRTRAVGRA